jgi:hypothetical protein
MWKPQTFRSQVKEEDSAKMTKICRATGVCVGRKELEDSAPKAGGPDSYHIDSCWTLTGVGMELRLAKRLH